MSLHAVQPKMRVAVLLGGASNEKEISLESGRNVCYKLSPEKYAVTPVFVDDQMHLYALPSNVLICPSTAEIVRRLSQAEKIAWSDLKARFDFIFLGLHGGNGENGVMQGTLEMLGLPYNGSSIFASALCMDKYKTGRFLAAQGFDTPQACLLSKKDFEQSSMPEPLQKFVEKIGFPCIVKPHDDGCSVMVAVAKDAQQLDQALRVIFQQKKYALVEEKIQGMELTVGVVGNENPRALAPSEAISHADVLSIEEKFLPGAGENQTPARLPAQDIAFVQRVIRDAYVAARCQGYARIDCFFQNETQSPTGQKRVVILEINTLPGLTPATCLFHQASEEGLRPAQLLDEIVQLGLQAHRPEQVISVDQALQNQETL